MVKGKTEDNPIYLRGYPIKYGTMNKSIIRRICYSTSVTYDITTEIIIMGMGGEM